MLKLPKPTFCTLTFCDTGENHAGMCKTGTPTTVFVGMDELRDMKARFEGMGGKAELVDLQAVLGSKAPAGKQVKEAGVLVLRDFLTVARGGGLKNIEHELEQQAQNGKIDSKAFMRGQVKNKHARHNNMIAGFNQAPDYANKKGTIVAYSDYPAIAEMEAAARDWMKQPNELVCEQNRYFDIKSCGMCVMHLEPFAVSLLTASLCLQRLARRFGTGCGDGAARWRGVQAGAADVPLVHGGAAD